jgi:hypothetical protein
MQYQTQSQIFGSQISTTQFKSQNVIKAPQNSASQVTNNNNRACFNCREMGHYIANCPYANNKPAASAFSNSVNGPRLVVSGDNQVPIRNNNTNNNSQQMRQPHKSFG